MATEKMARIELGLERDGATGVLILSTGKSMMGGIRSSATVMWRKDGFESFVLCDFSKTVEQSVYTQKATQKAIDAQFAMAFAPEHVAGLKQEVLEYYIGKPEVVDTAGEHARAAAAHGPQCGPDCPEGCEFKGTR